jgi:hypothetical protein
MAERIISLIRREESFAKAFIRRPHPNHVIGELYYAGDRDHAESHSIGHSHADHDRDTRRRSNNDTGFDRGPDRNYHANTE